MKLWLDEQASTKVRITCASFLLFEEQGFDSTTVKQIVSLAEVCHMTFFRHYPSRHRVIADQIEYEKWKKQIVLAPRDCTPTSAVAWGASRFFYQVGKQILFRQSLAVCAESEELLKCIFAPRGLWAQKTIEALVERGVSRTEAATVGGAMIGSIGSALPEYTKTVLLDPYRIPHQLSENLSLWQGSE